MLALTETALVYIRKADESKSFIGCGAVIEGPYVATCRHVWRDADGEANGGVIVEFPLFQREDGELTQESAQVAYACDTESPLPDLVLLGVERLPPGVMALSVSPEERFETGAGRIHAYIPSRAMDVFVKGVIEEGTVALGLRQISGEAAPGYWTEKGSSGAPAFVDGGMQLAGILRLSETGSPPIRQAFILPGSAIRRQLERMKTDAVAANMGVSAATIEQAIPGLDLSDTPVGEIAAKIAAAVAAITAKAEKAPTASNTGSDIDQARAKAAAKLGDMDTDGALAVWDELLAKDADALETLTRRRIAMLAEKSSIQKLRFDYIGALATLREIVRLDPDSIEHWGEIGDIESATGTLVNAEAAYQSTLEASRRSGSERDVSVSLERIGDVLRARDELAGSQLAYEDGLKIAKRLSETNPSNLEYDRAVSVSLNKIGDVRNIRNDLGGALLAFEEGLEIRRRLLQAEPSQVERARDVSVSLKRIGDIKMASDDLDGAETAFDEGLNIRSRLLAADMGNAERLRDVSVILSRLGDLRQVRKDFAGALVAFEKALEIARGLMVANPSHAERARDVSVCLDRVGDVRRECNDLDRSIDRDLRKGLISPGD